VSTPRRNSRPLGCKACRAIRQPISPSTQIQDHSIQNLPKPVSFLSSGVSSESGLTPLNPTITPTSGVHRLASQICHNRLFRKKLQKNILPMNSTEVSSLAAHNKFRGAQQRWTVPEKDGFAIVDTVTKADYLC
jgi:hypothetical protein